MSKKYRDMIKGLLDNEATFNPYLLMHEAVPVGSKAYCIMTTISNPYMNTIAKVHVNKIFEWNHGKKKTYLVKLVEICDDFDWWRKCLENQVMVFKQLDGHTKHRKLDFTTKSPNVWIKKFNASFGGNVFHAVPAPRLFTTLNKAKSMLSAFDKEIVQNLSDQIDQIQKRAPIK